MSTLGEERSSNPLLAIHDEEEFLNWFPGTFPAVPSYFSRMRPINLAGPKLRRNMTPPPSLNPEEFDALRIGALVVDVRPLPEYSAGHIPCSVSSYGLHATICRALRLEYDDVDERVREIPVPGRA